MYEIPTPEVPAFDPAVLGQMAPFYQMMPGMLQYQVGGLDRLGNDGFVSGAEWFGASVSHPAIVQDGGFYSRRRPDTRPSLPTVLR